MNVLDIIYYSTIPSYLLLDAGLEALVVSTVQSSPVPTRADARGPGGTKHGGESEGIPTRYSGHVVRDIRSFRRKRGAAVGGVMHARGSAAVGAALQYSNCAPTCTQPLRREAKPRSWRLFSLVPQISDGQLLIAHSPAPTLPLSCPEAYPACVCQISIQRSVSSVAAVPDAR
jgi:hypothetical protein